MQISAEMGFRSVWQPENADLQEAVKAIDQLLVGNEGVYHEGMYNTRVHALTDIRRKFY